MDLEEMSRNIADSVGEYVEGGLEGGVFGAAARVFGYVLKKRDSSSNRETRERFKGGYVESYANLSSRGSAWVGGEAKVYDLAHVLGDA